MARRLEDEDYCYLITTGRVSGQPREIEIWFALQGRTLYMLSGGRDRAQWVRNIQRQPRPGRMEIVTAMEMSTRQIYWCF